MTYTATQKLVLAAAVAWTAILLVLLAVLPPGVLS